ncbi:hypothetical protein [Arenivirga flava]|uniref:Uncharacterized protein n=1 Tax=Arenivirga flava TaxID=1930060 RepID=A0AA37UE00_9MICO|nr:hypothetical protein [Arenivirga flava]GMA27379.1 hypothetical protein GCM10025874_06320 [Arenivirga flava]
MAEWFTVLVTVPTLIYALVQLRSARDAVDAAREATQAETRPYVWLTFHESVNEHEQIGVRLCVANSGRTPAFDVVITFDDTSAPWKDPSIAPGFMFLRDEGGIRTLPPGAELRYHVGPWKRGAALVTVAKNRGVSTGSIEYRTADGRVFSEPFAISLRDLAGTGELKSPRQ